VANGCTGRRDSCLNRPIETQSSESVYLYLRSRREGRKTFSAEAKLARA